MKSGLILTQITKRYQANVHALESLDLELKPGELLTVVGPSGCGKSTLLKLVAGLEDPTSGEMTLDGKRLNEVSPKNRDIALMFQNYALFPHLNVRDNMAFGLIIRGLPKSEAFQKVNEVAKQLGIADLLMRQPAEISGGERQRAALGRALLRRPKLFLFDEPLSSLDAALRSQLRVEIGRLHRELEASMLYVTHDQSEALTLGDRIAVLNQGRLQQIATATTLYQNPANQFVAGFIGNPGMSFFAGHSVMESGQWFFHHDSLTKPVELPQEILCPNKSWTPGPITLGLRPEHLRLAAEGDNHSDSNLWVGHLVLTERWGGYAIHYLENKAGNFAIRTSSETTLPLGSQIHCHADWKQARLFDPKTGISLSA